MDYVTTMASQPAVRLTRNFVARCWQQCSIQTSDGTRKKTVPLLISHGHKLVDPPPNWLVQTSNLQGPFAISVNNPNVIVNSDGDFVAKTSSASHSKVISRLLDLAHKHGTIERLLAQCN